MDLPLSEIEEESKHDGVTYQEKQLLKKTSHQVIANKKKTSQSVDGPCSISGLLKNPSDNSGIIKKSPKFKHPQF